MENYISILRFVNNPLSDESIALGLIVVSENDVFFKMSAKKISFAKKLNPASGKLLDFSLKQLRNFIAHDLADQSDKLIQFSKSIDNQLLNRLANYNNGILQFSKPSFVKSEFNNQVFNDYFEEIIGEGIGIQRNEKPVSQLKLNIEAKIYKPLENKIDVNYTLKKKVLPTMFFDFHFDGLGVNGAMYAAKSVDFNADKSISDIRAEISEYESVIERLNIFAKSKNILGDPIYYLVADPYQGKTPSYLDLYSLLKNENMPFFKLIASNELDEFSNQILKNNVSKFSEMAA